CEARSRPAYWRCRTAQDVFGAIPADAQIQRMAGSVVAVPGAFSLCLIALDNGVTHIDQIDMAMLDPRVHGLVAGYPGRLGRVRHGLNCGISRRSRQGRLHMAAKAAEAMVRATTA